MIKKWIKHRKLIKTMNEYNNTVRIINWLNSVEYNNNDGSVSNNKDAKLKELNKELYNLGDVIIALV